ncbi:MAG: hypothetical protein ACK5LC_13285 [Coprobacillaceae bacterium]
MFNGTPEELIKLAEGCVGVFTGKITDMVDPALHITSRVNTAKGVVYRIVAETLPVYTNPVEPTLEDAYMYLIAKGGVG